MEKTIRIGIQMVVTDFFVGLTRPAFMTRTVIMDRTAMFLLKLHGSVNWRLKRGYSAPYAIDAVLHHKTMVFGSVFSYA